LDVPAAGTARVFSPAVCASADACAPFNIEAPAISARKTLEVIIPHKSPKPLSIETIWATGGIQYRLLLR
jgi:hypothetical protein